MSESPVNSSQFDEVEKHQLSMAASRLESEEKHAALLTEGFVRNIITLAAAVMTFGVSVSSVFKSPQFSWMLGIAWVSLLMTVVVGLIMQRRHRNLVKLSYKKLVALHEQAVFTRLGDYDKAAGLLEEVRKYASQEEAEYGKHFFHEIVLIVIFGFGLSFMTAFGVLNLPWDSLRPNLPKNRNIDTEWKQLSIDPDHRGYSFSDEALFGADIEFPGIKALTGKAKLLDDPSLIRLGYLVTADVEKLDLTKLPKKYREERKVKAKAGEFTIVPPEQVVYQVDFEFTFKDKDNFALFKIKSPVHDLFSGKENRFQNIIEERIPYSIASRTSEIVFSMSIIKCVTCSD